MTRAHGEQPGSVAEEAARLFAALQDRLGGSSSSECRYCPLCQATAALRGTRPEVAEHLVSAAAELVEAWRLVVDPRPASGADETRRGPQDGAPHTAPAPDAPSHQAGRDIEHIEVR